MAARSQQRMTLFAAPVPITGLRKQRLQNPMLTRIMQEIRIRVDWGSEKRP